MSFRIKPSAFDAARPVEDRIQIRGWIWRGRQELDGLCCIKGWFGRDQGWIGALTPWLEHASSILETDRFIILLFDRPVECDCAKLGRVLPLKRLHGALTSLPIGIARSPSGLGSVLEDQLVLFHDGERLMEPLSGFRPVEIADWWSFDTIAAEESAQLPLKPAAFRETLSRSSTPFDPDAVGAGLEQIRERIGKAGPSPLRSVADLILSVANNLVRIYIWILIIVLMISLASALWAGNYDVALGSAILICGGLIAFLLVFRLLQKLTGSGGGKALGTGGRPAAAMPVASSGPGFLRRAAGWLMWNSALGSGVRGKYEARLRELEKLFAQNKLDEALRKAVSLGEERKDDTPTKRNWFGDFPTGGPGIRDDLSLRYQRDANPGYGILSDPGFHALKEMYRQQAEALAEKGDYERAAFIYAELMGDAKAAVRIFERKGDFETAAKLAQGRRLAPSRFIPLWLKAGDKKRALRLAAQYDAFADLAKCVDESDPFHKELVGAWASRLIDSGDFAWALEVTEKYPEFARQRRAWIAEALERETADPVLIARALKCLPEWNGEQMQARFNKFLQKDDPDRALLRIRLARHLADRNFENAATDEGYPNKRLPFLALPLLRQLLEDEAEYGTDKARRDAALALSEASGQLALRVDIRRLNRVTLDAAPPPSKRITLQAASDLTPIRDAIIVPGNRLLIAYETGALHLTSFNGRRLWSDHVHNVRGFVSIGAGNRIIIVRDEIEGSALSLLNLDDRTHKDIGFFNIQGFHREASEIGWMVFGGGRVSMLDMFSLITAAKNGGGALEHHWAVPITEPGRMCGFLDRHNQASFLFHRDQGGLVEHWTLNKSTLQVDCAFVLLTGKAPADIQTFGWAGAMNIYACSEDGARIERISASLTGYSLDVERRLLAEKKQWLLPAQNISGSHFGERPLVWSSLKTGAKTGSVPSTSDEKAVKGVTWAAAFLHPPQAAFTVEFPEAERVDARIARNSSVAIAFDNAGRLVAIDCDRCKVLSRNDVK